MLSRAAGEGSLARRQASQQVAADHPVSLVSAVGRTVGAVVMVTRTISAIIRTLSAIIRTLSAIIRTLSATHVCRMLHVGQITGIDATCLPCRLAITADLPRRTRTFFVVSRFCLALLNT